MSKLICLSQAQCITDQGLTQTSLNTARYGGSIREMAAMFKVVRKTPKPALKLIINQIFYQENTHSSFTLVI